MAVIRSHRAGSIPQFPPCRGVSRSKRIIREILQYFLSEYSIIATEYGAFHCILDIYIYIKHHFVGGKYFGVNSWDRLGGCI